MRPKSVRGNSLCQRSRLAGQNSIHDTRLIFRGRDVGNVVVQRQTENGLEDVPYDVSFAFAFSAFVPDGKLHF